jgi:recombinational DNA repair ATPase RecF
MILAATEVIQQELGRPLLLLLDDPAAELDADGLARLMVRVFELGSQVVATALVPGLLSFPSEPAVFHVEHGELTREQ